MKTTCLFWYAFILFRATQSEILIIQTIKYAKEVRMCFWQSLFVANRMESNLSHSLVGIYNWREGKCTQRRPERRNASPLVAARRKSDAFSPTAGKSRN